MQKTHDQKHIETCPSNGDMRFWFGDASAFIWPRLAVLFVFFTVCLPSADLHSGYESHVHVMAAELDPGPRSPCQHSINKAQLFNSIGS